VYAVPQTFILGEIGLIPEGKLPILPIASCKVAVEKLPICAINSLEMLIFKK
jgi:hypothetical protein